MFRGIANATLDAKGRLPLPARFREQLLARSEGKVVLTIDMHAQCLLLYCKPDWEVVQRKVEKLDNMSGNARVLQRLMIGYATDLELDASGRVLVPGAHREHAELDKKTVVLGQTNKLELWSETLWQQSTRDWLSPEGRKALIESDEFGSLSI